MLTEEDVEAFKAKIKPEDLQDLPESDEDDEEYDIEEEEEEDEYDADMSAIAASLVTPEGETIAEIMNDIRKSLVTIAKCCKTVAGAKKTQ